MKRRPLKAAEPAAAYVADQPTTKVPAPTVAAPASKPAAPQIRYVDDATFRKAMDKVFREHDELFRKLAQ